MVELSHKGYNKTMFSNKAIKKLQEQVTELSEKMDKVLEKQNSQFTDVMIQLKETRNEIYEKNDQAKSFEDGDMDGTDDEMYENAKEVVIASGKASTSFIQRKLGIGYSRAAKLMETLEEQEVIGPANGATARQVLIKSDTIVPDMNEETDDLYEAAKEYTIKLKVVSTSMIQRALGVGYSRAAKLIEMMEEKGVIGVANGSKPREVIVQAVVH
jgi:DNA segregation ATPase FtsK/SpoIIIE-like protein